MKNLYDRFCWYWGFDDEYFINVLTAIGIFTLLLIAVLAV
ncbi:hypothetical protein RD055328_08720 [Companilactobacillus sp. RD055328]|nr:hypothetical protein RD055328_08720 [Companilactobacillus sp. RD055328]